MRIGRIAGSWTLAAALLAGLELGYAHLRQLDLWPLELIASSLWRLLGQRLAAAGAGGHLWMAPVGVLIAGLAVEAVAAWRDRRQSWQESRGDNDHE